jgi:hypothetical protein
MAQFSPSILIIQSHGKQIQSNEEEILAFMKIYQLGKKNEIFISNKNFSVTLYHPGLPIKYAVY